MRRCWLRAKCGGFVPGSVVGHRAFDGEKSPIVVGDDEVERRGAIGVGHGLFYS
jgi:hypothetical protein